MVILLHKGNFLEYNTALFMQQHLNYVHFRSYGVSISYKGYNLNKRPKSTMTDVGKW